MQRILAEVLEHLEERKEAVERAIQSLRALEAFSLTNSDLSAIGSIRNRHSREVAFGVVPGSLAGMTILDAAKSLLKSSRGLSTKEIAEALKRGGIKSKAKTEFREIVYQVLREASANKKGIVQVDPNHWALGKSPPKT